MSYYYVPYFYFDDFFYKIEKCVNLFLFHSNVPGLALSILIALMPEIHLDALGLSGIQLFCGVFSRQTQMHTPTSRPPSSTTRLATCENALCMVRMHWCVCVYWVCVRGWICMCVRVRVRVHACVCERGGKGTRKGFHLRPLSTCKEKVENRQCLQYTESEEVTEKAIEGKRERK